MFKLSHALTKGLLAESKCSFLKQMLLWLRQLLVLHYQVRNCSLAFYPCPFENLPQPPQLMPGMNFCQHNFNILQGIKDAYEVLRGCGIGGALMDELGVMCTFGLALRQSSDSLIVQQCSSH